MKEPTLKVILYPKTVKNVSVELPPMKIPDPDDEEAKAWKRLAPKRPKQQPEEHSKNIRNDE